VGRSIDDAVRNYRHQAYQSAGPETRDIVSKAGTRYRAAVTRLQSMRGRVIVYLKSNRVPAGEVFSYLSCAQRLYRLGREQYCLTLANEVRVLTSYWAGRGFDSAVLAGVCREVLGFAPGEPGERPCAACGRRRGCRLAAQ